MSDLRLLPLVIVAVAALLALKGVGLMFGEAGVIGGNRPAAAQDGAADQEAPQIAAAFPDSTASFPPSESPGQSAETDPAETNAADSSLIERVLGSGSRSRDAILESLSGRRQELDAREKEMDLRENLLKAAEQRLEQRIAELREIESRLSGVDEERQQEERERMKNLVTMYESMKPKDAARIFDRLDLAVVVQVASQMSARQMALVLAEMQSETAQRLTLELAAKPADPVAAIAGAEELPQIVGTRPAN